MLIEALEKLTYHQLHGIAHDINNDLHDCNRFDLITAITNHVDEGVSRGLWTTEKWIKDVLVKDS